MVMIRPEFVGHGRVFGGAREGGFAFLRRGAGLEGVAPLAVISALRAECFLEALGVEGGAECPLRQRTRASGNLSSGNLVRPPKKFDQYGCEITPC